jgi:hypothetical protein
MPATANPSLVLRRLHPWLGRAVHTKWTQHRSFYQRESETLLFALSRYQGRMPAELALRLEGFLGRLHREWFPRTWRKEPTFAEVLDDFRWWLSVAEKWGQPRERPKKASTAKRKPTEPLADQPPRLLSILSLPTRCTRRRFQLRWRQFLKDNHPDLNPDQTPEERRRFAEAVALWKR